MSDAPYGMMGWGLKADFVFHKMPEKSETKGNFCDNNLIAKMVMALGGMIMNLADGI